jgi:hypothetical protein
VPFASRQTNNNINFMRGFASFIEQPRTNLRSSFLYGQTWQLILIFGRGQTLSFQSTPSCSPLRVAVACAALRSRSSLVSNRCFVINNDGHRGLDRKEPLRHKRERLHPQHIDVLAGIDTYFTPGGAK